MKNTTIKLTLTATLSALALIANIYSIPLFGSTNYLSFVYVPCFIASLYLGPVYGFAVGFVGDVMGHLINPLGVYNPLIGIASGLLGVIPFFVFKLPKLNDWLKMILSFVFCLIICTSGLNTLALWLMYGIGKKTFFVYLWARLPFQLLIVAINCTIMIILKQSNILDKLLNRLVAPTNEKRKNPANIANDDTK